MALGGFMPSTLDEETESLLRTCSVSKEQVMLVIHEYYLTIDESPTIVALSLTRKGESIPIPLPLKTRDHINDAVTGIIEQFELNAEIKVSRH